MNPSVLAPVGPWLALPCPHLGAAPGPPDSPPILRRKLPVCVLLARSSKLHAPVDVDAHRTGLPSHRDDNTYANTFKCGIGRLRGSELTLGIAGRAALCPRLARRAGASSPPCTACPTLVVGAEAPVRKIVGAPGRPTVTAFSSFSTSSTDGPLYVDL